jgi:hypothetical protein
MSLGKASTATAAYEIQTRCILLILSWLFFGKKDRVEKFIEFYTVLFYIRKLLCYKGSNFVLQTVWLWEEGENRKYKE